MNGWYDGKTNFEAARKDKNRKLKVFCKTTI